MNKIALTQPWSGMVQVEDTALAVTETGGSGIPSSLNQDVRGAQIDERLIAVIALVADDFFDTVSVGELSLDLLGHFNQCLAAPSSCLPHRHFAP
jgi:hypothetical protein